MIPNSTIAGNVGSVNYICPGTPCCFLLPNIISATIASPYFAEGGMSRVLCTRIYQLNICKFLSMIYDK